MNLPPSHPEWKSEKAKEAIASQVQSLVNSHVFNFDEVRPWGQVRVEEKNAKVANAFMLLGIKHYEDPEKQKFKARLVYGGNRVLDTSGQATLFDLASSTPASISAARSFLAAGKLLDHEISAADAETAYLQAKLNDSNGITYVRLPRNIHPPEWEGIRDPVVPLRRALYGHPESGLAWQKHCDKKLKTLGWVDACPSMKEAGTIYRHKDGSLLYVYVDDFILSAVRGTKEAKWKQILSLIAMTPPEQMDRFLGANFTVTEGGIEIEQKQFLEACLEHYKTMTKTVNIKPCDVPDGNPTGKLHEGPGEHGKAAPSVLMKVMYAARMSRPDLLPAVCRLARHISCWTKECDWLLARLHGYILKHKDLTLFGRIDPRDVKNGSLRLELYVDADHAGEKPCGKSTSGILLFLVGDNTQFLIDWQSKKQSCAAPSTGHAETLALSNGLRMFALPSMILMPALLQTDIFTRCFSDSETTIKNTRSGKSSALRYISKTQKCNIGFIHDIFLTLRDDCGLSYVNTNLNVADLMTKALPPPTFSKHRLTIGLAKTLADLENPINIPYNPIEFSRYDLEDVDTAFAGGHTATREEPHREKQTDKPKRKSK